MSAALPRSISKKKRGPRPTFPARAQGARIQPGQCSDRPAVPGWTRQVDIRDGYVPVSGRDGSGEHLAELGGRRPPRAARTCSSAGSLSGRQRRKRALWRNRPFIRPSYSTSHDPLDAQRFPRQVLVRVPAARPARHPLPARRGLASSRRPSPATDGRRARSCASGFDVGERVRCAAWRPSRSRRRRDGARALVVVEAEQQRATPVAVLVHAVARDDAVARALVLHLQHRALARVVRARRAASRRRRRSPRPRTR